jgi:hypothetical protein
MSLVTTDDIYQSINTLKKLVIRPDLIKRANEFEKYQKQDESKLVKRGRGLCSSDIKENILNKLANLNTHTLLELANNSFYDGGLLRTLSCIMEAIPYLPPNQSESYRNTRIHNWFRDLTQIGEPSTNGIAMSGSLEDFSNAFVIKSPQKNTSDDLMHEVFVGMFGTNKLRDYIPNFAYVYGGFKCTPPIIDEVTKKVTSWCSGDGPTVTYVIYENIFPSITLRQYLKDCTITEFLSVFMQILYSLELAYRKIDYTHYDLHTENVLMRQLTNRVGNFSIRYQTERGWEYLNSNRVATFIDYGFNHIQVNGQHYGVTGLEENSIFYEESWIMYDVYKLLMTCAADSSENQPVFDEIGKIFRFFNVTESLYSAIDSQAKSFYALPKNNKTKNVTIYDLTTFIREKCNCDFIGDEYKTEELLSCGTQCFDFNSVLQISDLNEVISPNTLYEFSDTISRMQETNNYSEINRVVAEFDYFSALNEMIPAMEKLISENDDMTNRIIIIDLSSYTEGKILKLEIFTLFKVYITGLVSLRENINTLKNMAQVLKNAGDLFKDDLTYVNEINIWLIRLREVDQGNINIINGSLPFIQRSIDILENLVETSRFQIESQRYPELMWYINTLPDLLRLL